jgi:hypothetical protein
MWPCYQIPAAVRFGLASDANSKNLGRGHFWVSDVFKVAKCNSILSNPRTISPRNPCSSPCISDRSDLSSDRSMSSTLVMRLSSQYSSEKIMTRGRRTPPVRMVHFQPFISNPSPLSPRKSLQYCVNACHLPKNKPARVRPTSRFDSTLIVSLRGSGWAGWSVYRPRTRIRVKSAPWESVGIQTDSGCDSTG